MTRDRIARYRLGLRAESLAALYLRLKFYRIIARRYRTPIGEIDLIARRGKMLCFVEVKARASLDDAAFALTSRSQARIVRAAESYLSRHPQPMNMDLRFDLVLVAPGFRIRHLDNAWRPAA